MTVSIWCRFSGFTPHQISPNSSTKPCEPVSLRLPDPASLIQPILFIWTSVSLVGVCTPGALPATSSSCPLCPQQETQLPLLHPAPTLLPRMARSFSQETAPFPHPNDVLLDGAADYQTTCAASPGEKGTIQGRSTRGSPRSLRCRLKAQALFLGDPWLLGSHALSHVEKTDPERSRDKLGKDMETLSGIGASSFGFQYLLHFSHTFDHVSR